MDHVSYSEFHEGFIQIAYLIALCPRKLAFACISDLLYKQRWKNFLVYFKNETTGHYCLDSSSVASVNLSFPRSKLQIVPRIPSEKT